MNEKNLIPNAERTPEELREITRKGGQAPDGHADVKQRSKRLSLTF